MPASNVGKLLRPEHYGARQISVYHNTNGYFIKLDGRVHKLHGSTLWVTRQGLLMRGTSRHSEPMHGDEDAWSQDEDMGDEEGSVPDEDIELELAIQASLQDMEGVGMDQAEQDVAAAPAAAEDAPQDAGDAGDAGSGSRTCVICLTDGAACMLMRPCNHVCACQGCARRLATHPCPICRRHVRSVERVFF